MVSDCSILSTDRRQLRSLRMIPIVFYISHMRMTSVIARQLPRGFRAQYRRVMTTRSGNFTRAVYNGNNLDGSQSLTSTMRAAHTEYHAACGLKLTTLVLSCMEVCCEMIDIPQICFPIVGQEKSDPNPTAHHTSVSIGTCCRLDQTY